MAGFGDYRQRTYGWRAARRVGTAAWIVVCLTTLPGSEMPAVAQTAPAAPTVARGADEFPQVGRSNSDYARLEFVYVALNVADFALTQSALKHGAREANPIARIYVDKLPAALAVKGVSTVGVLYCMRKVRQENPRLAHITLGLLNLMYGFVVHHNAEVYFDLRLGL